MAEIVNPSETYFSIAAIVDQCCIDNELPIDKYFNKFLSWGLIHYKELKLDIDAQIQTVLLDVSDVNTVEVPPNFIDITKIGVPAGQYVRTFAVCNELGMQDRTPNNPQFSVGLPPGTLPNGTNLNGVAGGYCFNNYMGSTLFGYGTQLPNTGQYKIKKRLDGHKEILLDAGFSDTQIYLEGIALGINPSGVTVCHPYASEFVRAAINHEYEKFQKPPMRSEAAIERTGRYLWHMEQKTRGRFSIDKNTLLMITRKYYRLLPNA